MCRSSGEAFLSVASCDMEKQGLSLAGREFGVEASHVEVLETRLGLSSGVRQSLAGPVTALVAHVEACLFVLDKAVRRYQEVGNVNDGLTNALSMLRLASCDAKQTIGLMQHWKTIQQLTPGRKSSVNLGQLTLDCMAMLRSEFAGSVVAVDVTVASSRYVYVDQYGFVALIRKILFDAGGKCDLGVGRSHIECQDHSDMVVVRIRQKSSEAERPAASELTFRGISQDDVETIGRALEQAGGQLQWSIITSTSLDFGLSFPASHEESANR